MRLAHYRRAPPPPLQSFSSRTHAPTLAFHPQIESAERKRAELLRQADVRCLDAAAKFSGLMGPLQLVEQGMNMVSGRQCSLQPCESTQEGMYRTRRSLHQ